MFSVSVLFTSLSPRSLISVHRSFSRSSYSYEPRVAIHIRVVSVVLVHMPINFREILFPRRGSLSPPDGYCALSVAVLLRNTGFEGEYKRLMASYSDLSSAPTLSALVVWHPVPRTTCVSFTKRKLPRGFVTFLKLSTTSLSLSPPSTLSSFCRK